MDEQPILFCFNFTIGEYNSNIDLMIFFLLRKNINEIEIFPAQLRSKIPNARMVKEFGGKAPAIPCYTNKHIHQSFDWHAPGTAYTRAICVDNSADFGWSLRMQHAFRRSYAWPWSVIDNNNFLKSYRIARSSDETIHNWNFGVFIAHYLGQAFYGLADSDSNKIDLLSKRIRTIILWSTQRFSFMKMLKLRTK